MDILSLIYIFILGTFIGSFINVVGLRYGSGMSAAKGRSICFHCGTTIKWYDLIPVVSFLGLSGKCRACKSRLSWQYPIVEILTGIIFVVLALRAWQLWPLYSTFSSHGFLLSMICFLYYIFIWGLLLVIMIYDIRHKIIPDGLVYTFIALAFLKLALFIFFKGFPIDVVDMWNIAAPFIIPLPFAFLWFVSRGTWMGFGDVKLMVGIGALLGFTTALSAIILAFWIGAIWSIGLLLSAKYHSRKTGTKWQMKSEVPFAPFLILGTFIAFLTHIDILGLGIFFNFLH